MCVEDFNDIPPPHTKPYLRTRHALPNIPIAPPKRRRAAVERVRHHGALLDGPAAQDGEAAAEGAAVVELAVGQDLARAAADGAVVGLGPALLEGDDVRRRREERELPPDLVEPRGALRGDVEEAPAVEREEVDGGWWGWRGCHGDGGDGGDGGLVVVLRKRTVARESLEFYSCH
ncbi:hypothetical protein G7046_g5953 [Stylonectria norvegica]|nr:hypothetical protein G7046_g5953 [Stylonectria norvegica]